MLGRPPAEEDDQADAGGEPSGTVGDVHRYDAGAAPAVGGRRDGDRRRARRPRRRGRRRRHRLPGRGRRRAVRAVVADRDGHDFVAAALAAGAAAYLTARRGRRAAPPSWSTTPPSPCSPSAGCARRPAAATGWSASPARWARRRSRTSWPPRCAATCRTAASARSFNNELGVPLTLLERARRHRGGGGRDGRPGPGPHRRAVRGRPADGRRRHRRWRAVHTELFGTIDDVARAKGELVEALPADGTAVLNADDPRVAAMAARTSAARSSLFGAGGRRAWPSDVVLDDELRPSFRLRIAVGRRPTCASPCGARTRSATPWPPRPPPWPAASPLDDVAAGLGDAVLSPWRMELDRTPSGALVLNDAYNANPASMAAALRSLAALAGPPPDRRARHDGRAGRPSAGRARRHRRAGRRARHRGHRRGRAAPTAAEPVADARRGRWPPSVALGDGDAVLVKGSRVAGLERLAERLARPCRR